MELTSSKRTTCWYMSSTESSEPNNRHQPRLIHLLDVAQAPPQ